MRPDVVYTVVFSKDKEYLASPTVLGEFGREVRVEVPGQMRVLASATPPNAQGLSVTSAKMFLCADGAWEQVKEMTMEAYLSKTPSFQYSVPDTPYRFVVMPRLIVPAANDNEPGKDGRAAKDPSRGRQPRPSLLHRLFQRGSDSRFQSLFTPIAAAPSCGPRRGASGLSAGARGASRPGSPPDSG